MDEVIQSQKPYGDVVCDDGYGDVQHVLWKCPKETSNFLEKAFEKVSALYVADGHHRTAAAFNVGKAQRQAAIEAGKTVTGNEPFNFFMTLLYPSDNLMILDYNRVLKSLGDHTEESFLTALEENFTVQPIEQDGSSQVENKHEFSLYMRESGWYKISLKPEKLDKTNVISQLDSQIMTEKILTPLVGIKEIKKDSRVEFVGGIRGHSELEKRCSEDCVAAIAMKPVLLEELIAVADAGKIMPPKTTWFEPKPRSGFVVRCWDKDE